MAKGSVSYMAVMELRPDEVEFDPKNPRSEIGDVSDLVASIRAHGLIQPITVRRTEDGKFVVVAGNRRLAALKELKRSVSAIEVEFSTEKEYQEVSVAENIVRTQMSPVDEAKAVAALFRRGKGRLEIGAMFGKSARWAEARYRITKLGGKALEYLEQGPQGGPRRATASRSLAARRSNTWNREKSTSATPRRSPYAPRATSTDSWNRRSGIRRNSCVTQSLKAERHLTRRVSTVPRYAKAAQRNPTASRTSSATSRTCTVSTRNASRRT